MYHFSSRSNVETVRLSQRNSIPNQIGQYLKNFQIEAIRFMHALLVKQEFCIYNDESGLGKQAATAVLLSVIASNRKTLIVIQNDEIHLTGWAFHLNVLSTLHVKFIKDEQDFTHSPHNVYIITWGILRTIDDVNNHKFDYIVLDNRGEMLNNNFCTSVLLKHFKGRTNLVISSVDVTGNLKLLHNILLLGGCLEPQHLAYKHFEAKFKLPQSMHASCKSVDLDKYFRERQRLSDYCKRYCHQFEEELPLVLQDHYKINLKLWRDRQRASNPDDDNAMSQNRMQNAITTQELFEDFCRQRQNQNKKQGINLTEEQVICIENDAQIITDSSSEDLVNMSPLLIESDSDNDVVTEIPNTADIGQEEIVDITNDDQDDNNANNETINYCVKKKKRNELQGLIENITEKYKVSLDFTDNDVNRICRRNTRRTTNNRQVCSKSSRETRRSVGNTGNNCNCDPNQERSNLQENVVRSSNSTDLKNSVPKIKKNDVLQKKTSLTAKTKEKKSQNLVGADRRETRAFGKRLTRSASTALSMNHVSLESDRSSKHKKKIGVKNSSRKKPKINDAIEKSEKDTQTTLFINNSDSNDCGNMQCAQKLSDSSIFDNFINCSEKKEESLLGRSTEIINTPILSTDALSGSEVIFVPSEKTNASETNKNLEQGNTLGSSCDGFSLSSSSCCKDAISRRTKALKPKRMHNHALTSTNRVQTCSELKTKGVHCKDNKCADLFDINRDTANIRYKKTHFNTHRQVQEQSEQTQAGITTKKMMQSRQPVKERSCLVILEKMFNINKTPRSAILDDIITEPLDKVNEIDSFDMLPPEDVFEISDSDTFGSFIRVHLNGDISTMQSNIQRNQSAQPNKITNYLINGNGSKDNTNDGPDNVNRQNVRIAETNYSPSKPPQQLSSALGSTLKKSPKVKVQAQATKLTKWFLKHATGEQPQHVNNVQLDHLTVNDNDIIKTPSAKKQIKRRRLDLNFKN
ncbi:protein suppressor of underreplication isoform X2 [Glossina fuscipes]|uniref:Protein suppressor of underreplication isoform X2 n=1 Tax=Glossina fuscipes TaxID=7396 RepID=A0A8U0W5Z7_9MUSC|nr:protein suppressor of underreplication isoform X2 [Glossina fuscipes]